MLAPDTLLQNRYRIKHLLGKGGEGAVYFARDEQLDIEIALKACVIIEDRLLRQFERVARMLGSLEHSALPKVNGYFNDNNTQFLVMEYIPGDDLLETRAKRGSAFSTNEVLKWADQLLDALEYLHSHQPPIIHRDIKPQNIKLTEEGKVVLLDFGLSKRDASSIGIGTLSYAPLEQLLGKGTDVRSDLYSLAATFYHLMTGLQPANAWVRFNEPPDRLRPANVVNRLVSPAIADVLMQALSLEREGRPASATEMRRLLREAKQPAPEDQDESPQADAENVYEVAGVASAESTLSLSDFETVTLNAKGEIINRRTGQARYLIEDIGSVKIEMVEIRAGEFLMGNTDAEAEKVRKEYERYGTTAENAKRWSEWETPQHPVSVSSFYMGKYQVTQAEWRAVAALAKVKIDLNSDPSRFKGDDLPVEQVSWEEAIEFCERLSKATGKKYRLPTEAEWEYACRAGTTTPFAFGETITAEIVNYAGNYPYASAPKGDYRQKTTPVGSLGAANGFGLYDMHGNVWEWCGDWFSENYYRESTRDDPTGPGTGSDRMLRGGGWGSFARHCRSAFRGRYAPAFRNVDLGFRLVRTLR